MKANYKRKKSKSLDDYTVIDISSEKFRNGDYEQVYIQIIEDFIDRNRPDNIQQAYRHILSWNIGEYEAKRKIVNLFIAVSNLHLDGKLSEDNILPMFNELLKEILIFESEEQYIEFLKAVNEN